MISHSTKGFGRIVPSLVRGTILCVQQYRDEDALPFEADTSFYRHSSVLKHGTRKGMCAEGVKKCENYVLICVSQWMFPDTASFKGYIFECDGSDMNSKMEEYAQLDLMLFLPHHHVGDLKINGTAKFPYLLKLRG